MRAHASGRAATTSTASTLPAIVSATRTTPASSTMNRTGDPPRDAPRSPDHASSRATESGEPEARARRSAKRNGARPTRTEVTTVGIRERHPTPIDVRAGSARREQAQATCECTRASKGLVTERERQRQRAARPWRGRGGRTIGGRRRLETQGRREQCHGQERQKAAGHRPADCRSLDLPRSRDERRDRRD